MTLTGLLVFAAAYALAVATPGPGIAAVLARVLSRGTTGIGFFLAGFVIGDLIWFTLTAAGLSLIAQTVAPLFVAIKYAGALYLVFLAWKLWRAPGMIATDEPGPVESGISLTLASLSLTLGNPKVIIFFMALLPLIVDLRALTLGGAAEIAVLIAILLSGILAIYVFAAAKARRLFRTPRAVKLLNRTTGTVLVAAAVTIATR